MVATTATMPQADEMLVLPRPQTIATNGDAVSHVNGGTFHQLPNIMADGDDPRWELLPNHAVTFEQYVQWMRNFDVKRAEWEDGRIVLLPMATFIHQFLVKFLVALMDEWVERNDLGGEALPAPFPTRIATRHGREPDVVYLREERVPPDEATTLEGAPDIAVEIVSEGREKHDYTTKFFEYQQGGVREYWIIDPLIQDTQFHRLNDAGVFERVALTGESGTIFKSTVLAGLEIDTDWFWRKPRPKVKDIVRQWDATPQPTDPAESAL